MPELLTLLVAEPTVALGYMVFGMVGFGTTLVAAPILAHVLPVSTIIPALAITDLLAAWTNGFRLNANLVRAELYRLLPGMLIGSAFGAYILFAVPVQTLMLLLGLFVMFYALNGLRPHPPKPPMSARWAWWFGISGGVLTALFGAGGWVYAIYLASRLEDPAQFRATQTTALMVSSFVRVALFAIAGRYFEVPLLVLVACLLPAMAIGLYAGHHINLRLNRKQFMLVLYSVLLVTGGSLVLRALL